MVTIFNFPVVPVNFRSSLPGLLDICVYQVLETDWCGKKIAIWLKL